MHDPFFLDDPNLKSGRHRTVMTLPGFMESVIGWVHERELRAELNAQFRVKHPDLPETLSLSKIRKCKRLLLDVTRELDLEVSTLALAVVYFESLCVKALIDKANRKLAAATCALLAFKFNEAGPRPRAVHDESASVAASHPLPPPPPSPPSPSLLPLKQSQRHTVSLATLTTALERAFGVSRTALLRAEFDTLAELDFALHLAPTLILPHFSRALQQLDMQPQEYLGELVYANVFGVGMDAGLGDADALAEVAEAVVDDEAVRFRTRYICVRVCVSVSVCVSVFASGKLPLDLNSLTRS